ncbi:MAG: hypothetical protein AAGA53_17730, partial [Pseudomonadota bacterium]
KANGVDIYIDGVPTLIGLITESILAFLFILTGAVSACFFRYIGNHTQIWLSRKHKKNSTENAAND